MAKKIKFALEMADGANVRTSIEELREHYDQQSVLEYFKSGKLQEWLEDRYYEKEADEIAELSIDDNNLNEKLRAIINGVEYRDSSNENNSMSSDTAPLPEKVKPVPDKPFEEKKEYNLQDFFERIKKKYIRFNILTENSFDSRNSKKLLMLERPLKSRRQFKRLFLFLINLIDGERRQNTILR